MNYISTCESDINTLAEIHKALNYRNIKCSIEELRKKILPLQQDGYIGNEPTMDGINMYYIIYNPRDITLSPTINNQDDAR